jgi:hypothetical protein
MVKKRNCSLCGLASQHDTVQKHYKQELNRPVGLSSHQITSLDRNCLSSLWLAFLRNKDHLGYKSFLELEIPRIDEIGCNGSQEHLTNMKEGGKSLE